MLLKYVDDKEEGEDGTITGPVAVYITITGLAMTGRGCSKHGGRQGAGYQRGVLRVTDSDRGTS